jgi:hypothetical protein
MTHPSGAGYKHTPAFVERMKRAEGGEVQPPADGSDMEQNRAIAQTGLTQNQNNAFNEPANNAMLKAIQDSADQRMSDFNKAASKVNPAMDHELAYPENQGD